MRARQEAGFGTRAAQCSRHERHTPHPCGAAPGLGRFRTNHESRVTSHVARRRERGVTLIELVLSIVIIAIAVSAVLGVLTLLSTGSAEAMIRNQSVAIATAYLEEVRAKDFATNGVSEARALKGDINDYNGLVDVGARDQYDTAIVGLEQYTVRVTVGAGTMGVLTGVSIRRIDVNVQHPTGVNMTLSGYRTAL